MSARRNLAIFGALAILGAACAGPAPTGGTSPATGAPTAAPTTDVAPGTVTVMVASLGSERFDKVTSGGGSAEASYAFMLHGFLLETDASGRIVPGIASKFGLSDGGKTWSFTIRKGVKFHDGTEVTADDVLWTLQHNFGPGADKYHKGQTEARIAGMTTKIEKTAPDQVSISFSKPLLDFDVSVSDQAGGSWLAVLPKRAEQYSDAANLGYDKAPIGAGPFKLVGRVPNQSMSFERFDGFYHQPTNGFADDRRVKFQKLELQIVPEEAARLAALQSGRVDIAPISFANQNQAKSAGGRVIFGPAGSTIEPRLYGCWLEKFPCRDIRVRQALDFAIDKQAIQKFLGGPEVMQIKGWFRVTPFSEGYTPTLDPRPFDPAKARQLLADAGYPGGKGFGKLTLQTFPASTTPFQVETAQIVADGWRKELGLDVEVKTVDPTKNRDAERAGQLYGSITWQDNNPLIDARGSVTSKYGSPGDPQTYSPDPATVALVQQAFNTLDPAQRLELTQKLYVRLREEAYNWGIGYVNTPWAVSSRIVDWKPAPVTGYASALHTLVLKR